MDWDRLGQTGEWEWSGASRLKNSNSTGPSDGKGPGWVVNNEMIVSRNWNKTPKGLSTASVAG